MHIVMCIYLVYNIDNKTREGVLPMRKLKSKRLMTAMLITAAAILATACNKASAPIETLPMGTEKPVENSGEGVTESDTAVTNGIAAADNEKNNSESTASSKTDQNTSGKNNNSTSSSSKNDKNGSGTSDSTTAKIDSTTAASTKTSESSGTDSHNQTSAVQNETSTQAESTSQTVTEKNTEKPAESTTETAGTSNEVTTEAATQKPTEKATQAPTEKTTTQASTEAPTQKPTQAPTTQPETTTQAPTEKPTQTPTEAPTQKPTEAPTPAPHVHSYISAVTKAATCAEEGVITYACSCGDSYTESIPMTAHSFGDYIYNDDATTEADGTKTAVCSVCGATDTVTAEGTKKSLPSWYDEHSQQLNVATGSQHDGSLEVYMTDFDWTAASLGCWDFGYSSYIEYIGQYAEGSVYHGWLSKD